MIEIIEIMPGFYVWSFFNGWWTVLANWQPVIDHWSYFGAGITLMACQAYAKQMKAARRDCRLEEGDPVDDSKARITLSLRGVIE